MSEEKPTTPKLTPEQIADGWIAHDGGILPVEASQYVQFMTKNCTTDIHQFGNNSGRKWASVYAYRVWTPYGMEAIKARVAELETENRANKDKIYELENEAETLDTEHNYTRDLCREMARVLKNTNDLYEELQGHATAYSHEARTVLDRAKAMGVDPS